MASSAAGGPCWRRGGWGPAGRPCRGAPRGGGSAQGPRPNGPGGSPPVARHRAGKWTASKPTNPGLAARTKLGRNLLGGNANPFDAPVVAAPGVILSRRTGEATAQGVPFAERRRFPGGPQRASAHPLASSCAGGAARCCRADMELVGDLGPRLPSATAERSHAHAARRTLAAPNSPASRSPPPRRSEPRPGRACVRSRTRPSRPTGRRPSCRPRAITAWPVKRRSASAAAHSRGVIAGSPATNSHMCRFTTSGLRWPRAAGMRH